MRFFLCLIPLYWFLGAGGALAHEELPERLADVNKAIEHAPENPMLYLNRGELYREHGDFAEARTDFDRAMVLGNDLALAYFHIGRMQLNRDDLEGAEKYLLIYLERSATNNENPRTRIPALANLAMTYHKQGRYLDEADQYTKIIRSYDQPATGFYISRARAYISAGAPYLEQAQAGLNEGIEKLGPKTELLEYTVELDLHSGNVDSALARLDIMIGAANRKERLLFQRGQILEKADRQPEALEAYQQARQSIDKLPVGRRDTPSILKLTANIDAAVARQNPVK